jgi:hypothetical protein
LFVNIFQKNLNKNFNFQKKLSLIFQKFKKMTTKTQKNLPLQIKLFSIKFSDSQISKTAIEDYEELFFNLSLIIYFIIEDHQQNTATSST